jgi:methyltransferase (TIGR00027 family)
MQTGQPSLTARRAAAHRAVHQLIEQGAIFKDSFAVRILSEPAEALVAEAAADPDRRPMRLFIAVRHRFADEAAAAAAARGTRQLVVLGAGLDTSAYRNPHIDLRVFEVDHPATQAWKRERLRAAGITPPPSLSFVAVDFERDSLADRLASAGFDATRPSIFIWLGVVPYLTRDAVFASLAFIACCAASEVVFDYGEPPENAPPDIRAAFARRAAVVAALGEPWLTFFDPPVLHAQLRGLGFGEIEDLDARAIAQCYFGNLEQRSGRGRGHLLRARKS